jgi:hypothetical protein
MRNLIDHTKLCRKLQEHEPFKSLITREIDPGPECTSDEQLRGSSPPIAFLKPMLKYFFMIGYIINNLSTAWRKRYLFISVDATLIYDRLRHDRDDFDAPSR